MKVSVIRPDELGPTEIGAWRAMQRENPLLDNPFLSPEFAIAAGRVRPTSRVAVVEHGNEICGFLAYDHGRFRVGRPIAAGVCDAQALVRVVGAEWDVEELLRGCHLDVWEFDHLVAAPPGPLGWHLSPRLSSIIDLSQGYDAYVAERTLASRKIFKSTLAKERKLLRDLDGVRFELDARDAAALRTLMQWKSIQYRRTGRRDRFAVPWITELVRDLLDTREEGCTGTLSVLYASEGVAAVHFGLRSEASLSCWFPAYDMALAKYSPGLVLHLKMAEEAAAAGVGSLDLGKGDEEYKASLKSRDGVVYEGWIDRPSVSAVARRVQRIPRRVVLERVSAHPALRRTARSTLKQVGRVRPGPRGTA